MLFKQLSGLVAMLLMAGQLCAAELNTAVSLALSAMTAHVRLQSEGYTLIPF